MMQIDQAIPIAAAACTIAAASLAIAARQRRKARLLRAGIKIMAQRLNLAFKETEDLRRDVPASLPHRSRVEAGMRAALSELRRTAALDVPIDQPIATLLPNPVAIPVHGDVNLVALVSTIVAAWHEQQDGIAAPTMDLPVMTLEAVAAEAQAEKAIGQAFGHAEVTAHLSPEFLAMQDNINRAMGTNPGGSDAEIKGEPRTFAGMPIKVDPSLPPNVIGIDLGNGDKAIYTATAMDGLAGFGSSAAEALADLDRRRRDKGEGAPA